MAAMHTLNKFNKQIEIYIRNRLKEIAQDLLSKNLLSRELYKHVTDTRTRESEDNLAHEVFVKLSDYVEEDEDNYKTFVNLLSEKDKLYSTLHDEYSRYISEKKTDMLKPTKHFPGYNEPVSHGIQECEVPQLIFPALNDKELIQRLEAQSIDMQDMFLTILTELSLFIQETDCLDNIKWILTQKCGTKAILKSSCGSTPLDLIESEDRVSKIMIIISRYCSFFNFQLLEHIFKATNFVKGKEMLDKYKREFIKYTKNRVRECPTFLDDNDGKKLFMVILDDTFKDCHQLYLIKLKTDISKILEIDVDQLQIHGVNPGSIVVIYTIPSYVIGRVFPLSENQWSSLRKLNYSGAKILGIICDIYTYKLDSKIPITNDPTRTPDYIFKNMDEDFNSKLEAYIFRVSQIMDTISAALVHHETKSGINMHYYATEGDKISIDQLMRKGYYNPRLKNEHGNTALHCATQSGHLHLVQFFIEKLHFDPYEINDQKRSLLHLATISNNKELVEYTLHNCKLNACEKDEYDAVPLHYSCGLGNCDISLLLINYMTQNGVPLQNLLDSTCSDSSHKIFNPFHVAIANGHMNIIELFISKLGLSCTQDILLLLLSVLHTNTLEFLLYKNKFNDEDKCLAFYAAIIEGQLDSINYLQTVHHFLLPWEASEQCLKAYCAVKIGDLTALQQMASNTRVNINFRYPFNRTLLHLASEKGHLPIIQFLIEEKNCPILQDDYGISPLHLAAMFNHCDILKYFFSRKSDLMPYDKNEHTPFHYAAMYGLIEVIQLYLDNGIDPNLTKDSGWTVLHFACNNGKLHIVRLLIEQYHCNPLCSDKYSITPLHAACYEGHLHVVKYLTKARGCRPSVKINDIDLIQVNIGYNQLPIIKYFLEEQGCSHDVVLPNKRSLLHICSISGTIEIMAYLIEHYEFDLLACDCEGGLPLHLASYYGHLNVVQYLCELEPTSIEIENVKGNTPLILAAINNQTEVIMYLLSVMNCNLRHQGNNKETVLHILCRNGNLEVIRDIVGTGKWDSCCLDEYKRTPFMHACMSGNLDLVKYLVHNVDIAPSIDTGGNTELHYAAVRNAGFVKYIVENLKVNPCSQKDNGLTPLHVAVMHEKLDTVQLLIDDYNCNPNIQDINNSAPIHIAADRGNLEIVKFLASRKCDLTIRHNSSKTALFFAATCGCLKVVKFLISHGCNPFTLDVHGNLPIHYAAQSGQIEIVKYYIEELNCDINIKGSCNATPYQIAVKENRLNVVSYLQSRQNITATSPEILSGAFTTSSFTSEHESCEIDPIFNLDVISKFLSTYEQRASSTTQKKKSPQEKLSLYLKSLDSH